MSSKAKTKIQIKKKTNQYMGQKNPYGYTIVKIQNRRYLERSKWAFPLLKKCVSIKGRKLNWQQIFGINLAQKEKVYIRKSINNFKKFESICKSGKAFQKKCEKELPQKVSQMEID
jgi:hypothetical protein